MEHGTREIRNREPVNQHPKSLPLLMLQPENLEMQETLTPLYPIITIAVNPAQSRLWI